MVKKELNPVFHSLLSRWGPWLRIAITGTIMAFLTSKVNWSHLAHRFTSAHPFWLVTALLATLVSITLCGTRLWLLLRLQKIQLSWFRALRLTFVGGFYNLFLIGSTGGDAIRIFYLIGWFPEQKAHSTLAVLLDRVFGVTSLLGLGLLFLPSATDRLLADTTFAPLARALPWIFPTGGMVILMAFTISRFLPKLPLPSKFPGRSIVLDLIHSVQNIMQGGRTTVWLIAISAAVHLASFGGATFLAYSLELPVTYSLVGLMLILIFTASALPISVSGHGVREGVTVYLFHHLGISPDPETAIAYSLSLYGLGLFWGLLGGLASITLKSPHKK